MKCSRVTAVLAAAAAVMALLALGAGCQCAGPSGPGPGSPTTTATTATASTAPGATAHPLPAFVASTVPVTGHPRLWITSAELPRLRSWAVPSNRVYAKGLAVVARQAATDMDAGHIPAAGPCTYQGRYCESYALLFAFLSLVSPDAAARQQHAQRARTVLMHMMDRVAAAAPDDPLAKPRFSLSDRSRWAGEAFGLTVDWIYPHLSAADKTTIRKVFLRWAEQQLHAKTTSHNHPEPIGKLNDPVLVSDRIARRFAANNYFTAHLRNLGLMAMAFDPSDDPAEPGAGRTYPRLRDYLSNTTGAWLYMTDYVFGHDARGGTAPEGFEYAPRTLGFTLQLYLALVTAGEADPARHGPQVDLSHNPFWGELAPAFLHSLSPATVKAPGLGRQVYQPAWSGDGESYGLLDFIDVFAPLGLHAQRHGDGAVLEMARWIQLHTPAGGPGELERRASAHRGALGYRQAILYFLLFDPQARAAADPRKQLALQYYGAGFGQIFARTSWQPDATWFTYRCGWAHIDHQHGDANDFGFYRRGEWLTKERIGYGAHFEGSDQHNTVCIENDRPRHTDDARRGGFWKSGSQWVLSHAADPEVVAHSFGQGYAYALGDATGTYNSDYEGIGDVKHASRSILWLEPDHIIVYDRVRTGQARFKRFWLHTATPATVQGNRATAHTEQGQQLFVTSLLPTGAVMVAQPYDVGTDWSTKPARDEPMLADLRIEPAAPAEDVRFLHVLQGADRGQTATPVSLLRSTGGTPFEGAMVGTVAVLFPVAVGPVAETTFTLPATISRILVTGLAPNTPYELTRRARAKAIDVVVRPGSGQRSDAGGVLGG